MHLFDREAVIATIAGVVLAIAGIVVALVAGGEAAIIGVGIVGVAAVILLAVDFYLVGRSEDLDRMHHPHG
jgi:uncharacterized oligopeptide transporter (OPT) family protein